MTQSISKQRKKIKESENRKNLRCRSPGGNVSFYVLQLVGQLKVLCEVTLVSWEV